VPKKRVFGLRGIIVPKRRGLRFKLGRGVAQQTLDRLLTADGVGIDPPRVLVIVAHPDDEAIGAGALLSEVPDATVVHVTDGAPRDNAVALRRGFSSRDAYAEARRAEVLAALSIAGIDASRVRCMGYVDGEATLSLVQLCHDVIDLMLEIEHDIVLTHQYEGGHTDHDATAFAVHLACGILRREGVPAPVVLELTSYHSRNGRRVRNQFLPRKNVPERTLELPPEAQLLKLRMFEQFLSQRDCLREFPVMVERFRIAPRYTFTTAPHDGQLDYERYCATICGDEWRARASRALEMLRSKHRDTSSPSA
jgi:LmbE family N-acetylglucosaminyl deacetylase